MYFNKYVIYQRLSKVQQWAMKVVQKSLDPIST